MHLRNKYFPIKVTPTNPLLLHEHYKTNEKDQDVWMQMLQLNIKYLSI